MQKRSRDKAEERHGDVMRQLVRRYVTAEQRKRDDFGITEDDVMEIRQDISTLRYELIDIFKTNGMKTPNIQNQDNQSKIQHTKFTMHFVILLLLLLLCFSFFLVSGKKGKVMERRLLKDFHIGIVEGIVNEVVSTVKEPKDVFSQIAKVIGRRASSKHKKKDWNALVRQNTVVKDPIGSGQEAEMAKIKRQSLRKHILSSINEPVNIDHDKLIGIINF